MPMRKGTHDPHAAAAHERAHTIQQRDGAVDQPRTPKSTDTASSPGGVARMSGTTIKAEQEKAVGRMESRSLERTAQVTPPGPHAGLLALQRSAGNQAVSALLLLKESAQNQQEVTDKLGRSVIRTRDGRQHSHRQRPGDRR